MVKSICTSILKNIYHITQSTPLIQMFISPRQAQPGAAKWHEIKLMICFTNARCIGFLLHLLLQSSELLCSSGFSWGKYGWQEEKRTGFSCWIQKLDSYKNMYGNWPKLVSIFYALAGPFWVHEMMYFGNRPQNSKPTVASRKHWQIIKNSGSHFTSTLVQ